MRLFATILILSVLCCACHESEKASVRDADTMDIEMAVLPISDCEPYIQKKREGLYDSLGIKAGVTTYDAAMDIDTAVVNGRVNVIVSDTVRLNRLRKKLPMLQVVKEWTANYWLVTMDTLIRYPKNLREKTVAMTRFSAEHRLFERVMAMAGFEEGDCFPIQVNDINLRLRMLEQGMVDAALLPHPQADSALAHGARRIMMADSTERFVIAYRPSNRLDKEKVMRFLYAK